MNILEEGVLLLCCRLGEPIKPLTLTQFKDLGVRVRTCGIEPDRLAFLHASDLRQLGYEEQMAEHILHLLSRRKALEAYLARAERLGIYALTRVSQGYPGRITQKLSASRPPALFAMGDSSLLDRPAIAVVGSRDLRPENRAFAETVGQLIAREGFVLVSGGARGADSAAQQACLDAGGSCIVFLPDRLDVRTPKERVLYLSAEGYDFPFTSARALYRNKLIHMSCEKAFAVQCTYGQGGTWQGCTENLKHGWSELFVFDDGSQAMAELIRRGAEPVSRLSRIGPVSAKQITLF